MTIEEIVIKKKAATTATFTLFVNPIAGISNPIILEEFNSILEIKELLSLSHLKIKV